MRKKTQAQRKIEIFFFAIGGCELVIRNAVAKWPAASQGFKITKWPAVWYFSQILRNQRNPSSSNYHMSINDCQAIQKSCIGHNSNAWFTLSAGSKTVVTGCRSFSHSDSENKHLIKFNQERNQRSLHWGMRKSQGKKPATTSRWELRPSRQKYINLWPIQSPCWFYYQ